MRRTCLNLAFFLSFTHLLWAQRSTADTIEEQQQLIKSISTSIGKSKAVTPKMVLTKEYSFCFVLLKFKLNRHNEVKNFKVPYQQYCSILPFIQKMQSEYRGAARLSKNYNVVVPVVYSYSDLEDWEQILFNEKQREFEEMIMKIKPTLGRYELLTPIIYNWGIRRDIQ